MNRKDRYNGSGCLDMTAYLALRNIQREETKKKRRCRLWAKDHSAENEGRQQVGEGRK